MTSAPGGWGRRHQPINGKYAAFAQKCLLPFPLLSDPDGRVAARYGALT